MRAFTPEYSVGLSDQQFDRTRRLAARLAGIELVDRHRELLARRSRRLGIRDDAGLETLLNAAEEGEPSATQRLLCLLTTKFTGFFRHPRHFDIAAKHALQAARLHGLRRQLILTQDARDGVVATRQAGLRAGLPPLSNMC